MNFLPPLLNMLFFSVQALIQVGVLHKISCITWLLSIFNLHHSLHSCPWVGGCPCFLFFLFASLILFHALTVYIKLSRPHSVPFSPFNIKGYGFDLKNETSRWRASITANYYSPVNWVSVGRQWGLNKQEMGMSLVTRSVTRPWPDSERNKQFPVQIYSK